MNNHCNPRTEINVRYMVGSDLPRCEELSRRLRASQIKAMLCQRGVTGRVYEVGELVVAFEIHSKHKWLVEILDLGFADGFEIEAGELIGELQERVDVGWGSVREILCCLPEYDLPNQLLLQKCGFLAKMMPGDPPLYRFGWRP